jgi:hypothetical protein
MTRQTLVTRRCLLRAITQQQRHDRAARHLQHLEEWERTDTSAPDADAA